MKKEPRTDPRYKEQQKALNEIAARFGVVAYRPDYHRARGDKNTVLFYTKEDEVHNRKVDRQPIRYTRSEAADLMKRSGIRVSPDYIYRDHIWSFENTDVNGLLSMDFANFGKVDLRGERWEEVLEGHIHLVLARKRQREYVMANGGYLELREADEYYNNLNREQLEAMRKIYGTVFLGSVNFYDEKRERVVAGTESVYEAYTGQMVFDFGCSFCTPKADKELEELIRLWNGSDGFTKQYADVDKITSRVEALGGINFVWY